MSDSTIIRGSATAVAARAFNRRTLLKSAAVTGIATAAAPLYMRSSWAQSGQVNIFGWAGYFTDDILAAFQEQTGITPNYVPFGTNDEQLNQLRAAGGSGFDIIMPTVDRFPNYVTEDLIEPIDESKIEWDKIGEFARNQGILDGKRWFVPTHWGTEALLFNADEVQLSYGASLGELWKPEYAGRVTVRGHSGLAGVGRWLEAQGELPHPFIEGFSDEDKMRAIWDKILEVAIANKPSIGQFWSSGDEAVAAFATNGCVIGQNWGETAIGMRRSGFNVGYLAPVEGAFAWLEGYCIPKNAPNAENAYVWMNWFLDPANGAAFAETLASNSVAIGAAELASPEARSLFEAAYPEDALSKLWWWPFQDTWYVALRNEYQDRYLAA